MSEVELLAREYVEELVCAGAGKVMRIPDIQELVTNLVLNTFDAGRREVMRAEVETAVEFALLPNEFRPTLPEIDRETTSMFRKAMDGR